RDCPNRDCPQMSAPSFFANRTVVIATMHHKEQAIAPLIESALSVTTLVPPNFNTDRFGTFTRETKRPADQLATARLKAQSALELTGETLAIASEGSFGPHPQNPLVPCNRELVLLHDRQHQLEIVGEALTTKTNHQGQTIHSLKDALTFAQSVGFPEHGVVIMPAANNNPKDSLAKGIATESALKQAVTIALDNAPRAYIETDMRALYNPTRMDAIAQATQNLLTKIEQRCPNCSYPGFSISQKQPGLPCQRCQAATLLTLSAIYRCRHCQFQSVQRFPDGITAADPAHCFCCNP
ncbi:MAG: DUF6671 family protein, partial [Cyanobacteria bacterium J06649_5]